MKKLLCALMCLLLLVPMVGLADEAQTYEVQGFSPMKIAIAVEDGKIASFEVVEHSETPGFGADLIEKGFSSLIGQDVASATFDAVSGATMTSDAIKAAIVLAANGAEGSPAVLEKEREENGNEPTEFSFRNGIKFGMTKAEVLEKEDATLIGDISGELLAYSGTAAGKSASIAYQFVDGKLDSIGNIFSESHTNNNMYIDDYEAVEKSLAAKYGEPTSPRFDY